VIDYHCALHRFIIIGIPMILLSAIFQPDMRMFFLVVIPIFFLNDIHIFFLAATDKRW
jgi:hypothetical protein